MPKQYDLTGLKFNRLSVIELSPIRTKNGAKKWVCKCECGNKIEVNADKLKSGHTKSCGCLQKEKIISQNKSKSKYEFGECKTRLYSIWQGMNNRTNNLTQSNYKYYGGRV